ncbi:hypothetical protein SH2C18_04610 [Clostridium sediminicola]|uniref:hypothetical protein n=1 Tax=Clostridium sediminicola TaxID=3114879 RepID=UPI0031F250DF
MRLAFNFKNSKRIVLTKDETKTFIKKINYLKLLKVANSKKESVGGKFTVRGKDIKMEELASIEMIL